ncbi:single-stranded-DNA-specific exonuclease [Pullulanibacillus pueri]|uniref:Single-stranded-DNA-specific exonuclease RecJ n=1 Tax=Pullulanibacillus pueri TaxID=1437324 RepID=A0A8J2ZXV8_9BACL|nr:single-stranded-DNA-specific exonuclease RecJ [Pullulanibacillus pueri]MBM7683262.1 single-stranded-DNA-specific exonuclease [Pullulanibacillus pueri]GGH85768.1 single-stranded-DNA-specific exonuclease RecJ [Pullulanibacillus pueri]
MLQSKTRWEIEQQDEATVNVFVEALDVSPVLAKLLVNRGLTTLEAARDFLTIEDKDFHSPYALDGMEEAVHRIRAAIHTQEKILVFGDYDADGVTATSLMVTGLKKMGANVSFYVPHRFSEGYGPNVPAFEKARQEGVGLIITVDTGIAAHDAIEAARLMGLDVIITDHHEPPPELPKAEIIINPKKPGCPYPFKGLAGVGVAFKVIHALWEEVPETLLDLVAIGTIADLVPLIDENRLLAIKGLKRINERPRLGIEALLSVAGIEAGQVSEDNIGFGLGPRINAAGRMDHAKPAIDLMLSENAEEAARLAQSLDEANIERKRIVEEMTNEALQKVELIPDTQQTVIVVAGEDWHEGVVGIVASRIVEAYYRPTIVLSIDPETGMAKGSARSIDGFDIFKALSTCKDLLPHFGGHEMAAGMSLATDQIEALRTRLNIYGQSHLTSELLTPLTRIDQVYPVEEISVEGIEALQALAPFGVGNPKPRFVMEHLAIHSMKQIGSNKDHLKFTFEKDDVKLEGVGFRIGDYYQHIAPDAELSVVGELSINEWNGFRKPQILIEDLRVPQWQLFDWRGQKDIINKLKQLPAKKRQVVCFNEETPNKIGFPPELQEDILFVSQQEIHVSGDEERPYLVFLDLPESIESIQKLFNSRDTFPGRIYAIFVQTEEHFFTAFPTREQFKWLYAFLIKQKKFSYKQAIQAIVKHKTWGQELIEFMFKVFFELDFAKIEEDFVYLNESPNKRPLTESLAYSRRLELSKLEELLCYSSRRDLVQWFKQFNLDLTRAEEATV